MQPHTPVRGSNGQSSVREAAAEFIRGTTLGWGRRELASWLVCHYAPCLAANALIHPDGAPVGGRHGSAEGGTCDETGGTSAPAASRTAATRIDDEELERLILCARSTALRLLSDLAWPSQAAAIAKRAIASGAVMELRDALGWPSWAPIGRRRMRLTERVASLFVADALNAPHEYRPVTLCRHCGELGFSLPVIHSSWCESARRVA